MIGIEVGDVNVGKVVVVYVVYCCFYFVFGVGEF